MRSFYEDTFGLERIGDPSDRLVFFKIADGHNGHTAVLALFRRDAEVSQEETIGRAGAGGLHSGTWMGPVAISLCPRPRGQPSRTGLFRSSYREDVKKGAPRR